MWFSVLRGPLVLAACCAGAITLLFHLFGPKPGVGPYVMVAFFTLLSVGGRYWHARADSPQQAVRSAMLAMALKMLISLVVLLVVVFASSRERVLVMALTFGCLYLVYLVFDTLHQVRTTKQG